MRCSESKQNGSYRSYLAIITAQVSHAPSYALSQFMLNKIDRVLSDKSSASTEVYKWVTGSLVEEKRSSQKMVLLYCINVTCYEGTCVGLKKKKGGLAQSTLACYP